MIRSAIAWTERGLAAVTSDPALTDVREEAHDALWQAYEQAAMTLLQRQEFPEARQVLHEALDDTQLPAARAAEFRGLLSGTFGGEIGQLTAQAILSMQEGRESEAVATLQRAEKLLDAIPIDVDTYRPLIWPPRLAPMSASGIVTRASAPVVPNAPRSTATWAQSCPAWRHSVHCGTGVDARSRAS